jgi:hypothetical protein
MQAVTWETPIREEMARTLSPAALARMTAALFASI